MFGEILNTPVKRVEYHIIINFVFSDESDAGENDLDTLINEINDFGK